MKYKYCETLSSSLFVSKKKK